MYACTLDHSSPGFRAAAMLWAASILVLTAWLFEDQYCRLALSAGGVRILHSWPCTIPYKFFCGPGGLQRWTWFVLLEDALCPAFELLLF